MRYWFHSGREEAFALEVPPPDGMDVMEINEDTYKEIVLASAPATVTTDAEAAVIAAKMSAPPPKPPPTWADLARIWLEMQDARDTLKADYEAADAKIKVKQDKYSEVMLGLMRAMKADKLETVSGEIVVKEQTHVNAAEWPAIWRYVAEHDKWQYLQKRLTSSEILKDVKAGGELPPGMNTYTDYKLSVKKPGGRKALPKDDEGAN
jgi:hypothetical protein